MIEKTQDNDSTKDKIQTHLSSTNWCKAHHALWSGQITNRY